MSSEIVVAACVQQPDPPQEQRRLEAHGELKAEGQTLSDHAQPQPLDRAVHADFPALVNDLGALQGAVPPQTALRRSKAYAQAGLLHPQAPGRDQIPATFGQAQVEGEEAGLQV